MEPTPLQSAFFNVQAQTSPHPLAMEVSYAKGTYIYDHLNRPHLDFVAGVSACSLGHQHPKVTQAIKDQLDRYAHVMVYGEYVQGPAVQYCQKLTSVLDPSLDCVYLVNSGTEATEGALKLARRVTGRTQWISCHNAYHGNTMGAMSVMGYEARKAAFRPLIPDVDFIAFNHLADLERITEKTAGVLVESIQGGAGFIMPENGYLQALKARCEAVGALLIIDEIQPGFGRTGTWFGYEHFGVVPDILVIGKGMAGGMPVGAFVARHSHMALLKDAPKLGHITTFGGHPVIAAACLATMEAIEAEDLMAQALVKEQLFRQCLQHPLIEEVRGKGLMLAAMTPSADITNQAILQCHERGLILFWLLFEGRAIRITPPLTISPDEIRKGCDILLAVLDEILQHQQNQLVD